MRGGERLKRLVRERYGRLARGAGSCCAPTCDSRSLGYTDEELSSVPEGADLGLGCGSPLALAALKPGETVVDLGSGAGIDCFLAARMVGARGRVIGVDMTPEMVGRARASAREHGYRNVDFRLGAIEELPIEDRSADVVISNCVINLSPDKRRVFGEALRVLRPGGRLVVSDVVLARGLPQRVRESLDAYLGCVAGAALKRDYLSMIQSAGFERVRVLSERSYGACVTVGGEETTPARWARHVLSVTVGARRPGEAPRARAARLKGKIIRLQSDGPLARGKSWDERPPSRERGDGPVLRGAVEGGREVLRARGQGEGQGPRPRDEG